MFYSQFILAKKGPLGTIWIAAHLERKLRKNQVADTDIGVSVDSILSPDVPIALRLSSHLLLGVVRIYSRKVNYLFDDCSDALLKVKQAFRSTVVDLPPEESKAPYHSITLPETFDLDDFELPDTEVFLGNFVDHHVSAKEQITLQDTMDGVVYSTSQFGLDERFGDGDASQIALDLDEELLLNKGPSGHGVLLASRVDPDMCVEPSSSQRGVELDEEMHDTSQYVGSPSTTQPMELTMPSNISHISGLVFEPSKDLNPEFDQNESLGNSELECGKEKEIELKESTVSLNSSDKSFSLTEQADHQHDKSTVSGFCSLTDNPSFVDQSTLEPALEAEGKLDINFNAENKEGQDSIRPEPSEVATDDAKTDLLSVCKPLLQPCGFSKNQENGDLENLVSLPKSFGVGSDEISGTQDATEISLAKVPGSSVEAEGMLEIDSNAENREGMDLIRPEASEVAAVDAKADMLSVCKPMFQPCNSSNNQESAELDNLVSEPTDIGIGSEKISGIRDSHDVSVAEVQDFTSRDLNEEQFIGANLCKKLVGQPVTSEAIPFQKGDDPVAPEFTSPEKMLSLPDVPVNKSHELFVEATPERHVLAQGDQDATTNRMSGKKRSLTESTITLQSQNSVDTSEAAQSKRSVDFVPDDDDLLSSILVGRRSTVLKVKSTPPASDLVSSKRPRITPRSGAYKRKVLVDDSMVLHGDTIRQQLVSTEDIRRVRKKAPSTQPEIWILHRQFLEEEMFNEPIFTGLSSKLISLHCHPYDLSETNLVPDDGSKAQSTANGTILSPNGPTVGDETEFEGVSSVARVENCPQSAVCAFDTPIEQNMRVFSNLCGSGPENERVNINEAGHTTSLFDISESRTEMETECRSEPIGDETLTNSEAGHTETDCRIASSDLCGNALENETTNNTVLGQTSLRFDISENGTEMGAEYMKESVDDEKNHSVAFGIETSSCLPCAFEKNADLVNGDMIQPSCSKDVDDAGLSEQGDVSCLKSDEQSNGKDALLTEGIDFGEGVKEALEEVVEHRLEETYLDIRQEDADSVVPVAGAQPECSLPVNDENIFGEEMRSDEGVTHELGTVNKDGFHESDLKYDEQREDSRLDPSDPVGDAFDHDTDFLNFDDDDEIAEDDENSIPNAGGPQVLDNIGWSTRTRAVANYLQVLFHKEAQHGRTVLRLDNLLANKTRKEASRMFFETLVLKTRDYIHVDEEVPFGNINIKPRARLLKSEF
ncbi:hypothetical protein V2J09_019693 [Rumex salicifolius]